MLMILCSIFSAGCPSDDSSSPVDMTVLRNAIDDGNAAWIAAMKKGDASAVAACWSEYGQMLGLNGKNVVGRTSITAQMATLFSRRGPALNASVTTFDIRV